MTNIGICVITYNRINSLKRVLKSLNAAQYPHDVDLIISVDKSDNNSVADYANDFDWQHGNKQVIIHSENLGLRKHVLSCGELLRLYDALVVLEDDTSVAKSFFYYVEQCVDKYSEDNQIAGISLYNFPLHNYTYLPFMPLTSDSDIFLMQVAQSWGQVWMRRQWQDFKEWYDLNNEEFGILPHLPASICEWPKSSWLKYHNRYCIENNKYFVYPYVALSTNNSDAGTHNIISSSYYQATLLFGLKKEFKLCPTVKYDGFFESEIIYQVLGLDPESLCVDIYGLKGNREHRRYWLSCQLLPYKAVKSFALSRKPAEYNILENIPGKDIFLYDTTQPASVKSKSVTSKLKSYFFATDFNLWHLHREKIRGAIKKILKL